MRHRSLAIIAIPVQKLYKNLDFLLFTAIRQQGCHINRTRTERLRKEPIFETIFFKLATYLPLYYDSD